MIHTVRRSSSAIAIILSTAAAALSCDPTPIEVSRSTDSGAGSLRAAISTANGSSSAARIELSAGTYELTRCGADDRNNAGDLDITTNAPITIAAKSGAVVVIRQTCAGERVLDSRGSGLLKLVGVTLTGGTVSAAAGQEARGGALRSVGDVELESAVIRGNSLSGGAATSATVKGGAARGGGAYVGGALKATDSRIESNTANGGPGLYEGAVTAAAGGAEGGGAYVVGPVHLIRTRFDANEALAGVGAGGGNARGGALAQAADSSGAVTLDAATFSGNRAVGGNTSVLCSAEQRGGDASGGAVAVNGVVTGNNVQFTSNSAGGGSGGWGYCSLSTTNAGSARGGALVATKAVTLAASTASQNSSGAGSPTIICKSGGVCEGPPHAIAEGGGVYAGATLAVTGGSYSGNVTSNQGGALFAVGAVTVEGGEFTGNYSASGDLGFVLRAGADATIRGVSIRDNVDPGYGMAFVHDSVTAVGRLTIVRTLIRHNGGVSARAIDTDSVTFASTTWLVAEDATLVNTTVTGPEGGVSVSDRLALDHVTVADSSISAARLATYRSVVLAGSAPACSDGIVIENAEYNWFSDASCALPGATNQQSKAGFFLTPLADNGGPVPTRVPSLASVLVDRIPSSACPVAVDARGIARPQGAGCDIGAVEVAHASGTGATDLAIAFTNPPQSVAFGEAVTWQVTVRNKGPRASVAAALIDVPADVTVRSVNASAGGICTIGSGATGPGAVSCSWNTPLGSGASAVVSVVGEVSVFAASTLAWHAIVAAPQLTEPKADDTAALATAVVSRTGLDLNITTDLNIEDGVKQVQVIVNVTNLGPSVANSTPEAPIQVSFQPAAGVIASSGDLQAVVPGPIHAGQDVYAMSFKVSVSGNTWPTVLGTFELDPGANQLAGSGTLQLVSADLALTAVRAAGVQPAGTPATVRLTVTNNGPGAARKVRVVMNGAAATWSPQVGSVDVSSPNFPVWTIPALAPGQVAVLDGSAPYVEAGWYGMRLYAGVRSEAVDLVRRNDSAELDVNAAPSGTADLLISGITLRNGSSAGTRVVRVNIRNAGASTLVTENTEQISMYLESPGAPQLEARALTPGWVCTTTSTTYCATMAPMASGATASIEYVVQGSPYGGEVGATVRGPSFTPDPNLANNTLFVAMP
jgi:hypothetical protein